LDREEVRRMWQQDIRKTRAWQEAYEEGFKEAIEKERAANGRELLAKGNDQKTVAETLEITLGEVRRLAGRPSK